MDVDVAWTVSQKQRLKELNASLEEQDMLFENAAERDQCFQKIERALIDKGKERLEDLRVVKKRPSLSILENKLAQALTGAGFVQVVTPIILARGLLAKMTITDGHPLHKQVFWLDEKRCLRPMLAPNLYFLLKDLVRLWEKPIRIFEVGPCFRKESHGALHMNEFTMLNLVELGLPQEQRFERLRELAELVMDAAGIKEYSLQSEQSEVYGDTIDVVAGGIELGSGAMGPHLLDSAWDIYDAWVGIGFGLERLLAVNEGSQSVQRMGRSLTYLDSVRLNI
ncbi:MAG: pyrrolysine--tRNA(Pyl) ligase large subunit [Bacillota bacterium]